MSNEHDRLLAEGPRVAPEPRMATDDGALLPPVEPRAQAPPEAEAEVAPVAATTTTAEPTPPSRSGRGSSGFASGLRPAVLRRLIPVLFALIVVARSLGGGHVEAVVFGVLAVAVVTLILVRKARQL
jgi:hypothetical protein